MGGTTTVVDETVNYGAVALLAEDPDLAATIPEEERPHAERLVVVPALTLGEGLVDFSALAQEPQLGFLVLEGFVTVDVLLDGRTGSHLAGPGDVLHGRDRASATLPAYVTHSVNELVRVAVLDRRFLAAVRRWPELLVAVHDRLRAQEQRQAVHAAIGKLRRTESRVLATLWHLGERWGRMSSAGVIVPLALTHDAIGRLAGAERPTVTLAITALTESGVLMRRSDGAYVLHPESWRSLDSTTEARRRRAVAVKATPASADVAPPTEQRISPLADREALRERIAALREELPERVRQIDSAVAAARAATERSKQTRKRLAAERVSR